MSRRRTLVGKIMRTFIATLSLGVLLIGSACGEDNLREVQNHPPIAQIEGGNRNVVQGIEIAFDGSKSRDVDGDITAYNWSFGDNTTLDSAGSQVSHTFNTLGEFEVSLSVVDAEGATDEATVTITVTEPGANQAPTVAIWGAAENVIPPAAIASGVEVTFTGIASDPDGLIANWNWNFGDGTQDAYGVLQADNSNQIKHTFTNTTDTERDFIVTLSVTDDGGIQTSTTSEVKVMPGES